jgi:hypothetical protein
VISLVLLSTACASAPPRPRVGPSIPSPAAPSTFITSFWCGPPHDEFDDVRAEEIVTAGFTIVGPPCEGPIDVERNQRALDVAARHGLTMWISDARFNERARTLPNWKEQVAAAVAAYKDRPGFGGYFVTDEPSAARFDDLAAIVAELRAADRAHVAYINLLADYIPGGLGVPTYGDYIERFTTTVRPSLLSYDYYPFEVRKRDRPSFFSNLALVRDQAQRHGVPFMLIVLAMPHGPYRDPTEAELSWQVFHALAYGARGISYFAYWTPMHVEHAVVMGFRHGLIERGAPTRHYAEAARLNRVLRILGRELETFRSVGVADSKGEVAAAFPLGPISGIVGGIVTAGLFVNDAGDQVVMLVNRDYRSPARIELRMRDGRPAPDQLDIETGRWNRSDGTGIRLSPGGAQLLRWHSDAGPGHRPASPEHRFHDAPDGPRYGAVRSSPRIALRPIES